MVSIVCPIYNEERYIEACIQSVLQQDLPADSWELLLLDGGSTDSTLALVQPYAERYSNIHLLNNPHQTAPYAMNIGIRAAKGEYICRMDAHASYPTNYVSTLLRYMDELPDAGNVGGVCDTRAANDTTRAQAIALACSHPMGVGNSTFRITTIREPRKTDTVPFGFWRKSLFDTVGMFDETLPRNEDDELNARIIRHGYKVYLVPQLSVIYYVRDNIRKTGQMFYQYGLFKPMVNQKLKRPATLRQFVPPLFISGLIIGLPLCFIHPAFLIAYIACIMLYLLLIGGVGIIYKNRFLPLVFIVIHFSYGWGYLAGYWKLLTKQPFHIEVNR